MSEITVDELAKQVLEAYQALSVSDKQIKLAELEKETASPEFWQDQDKAAKTTKRIASLKEEVETWAKLKEDTEDLVELNGLSDAGMAAEIEERKKQLLAEFKKHELQLRFNGPYDGYGALLTVQAGAGGRDAQDWATMLIRMYTRWAEKNQVKIHLIDESLGEEGGTKSATLTLDGSNLYGRLKNEHGVHRLVRKSPFNSAGSRETSFAMVEVLPQIEEPDDVKIDEKDLKVDVYRASGKGGQSVNTTDSAVRVTHQPTGITVAIQNERSQIQNKETALKILRSKLVQLQLEQHQDKISDLKGPSTEAAWGHQIRNYVMHPYKLVKDTRSGYETSDVEAVLDGELNPLIEAGLRLGSN